MNIRNAMIDIPKTIILPLYYTDIGINRFELIIDEHIDTTMFFNTQTKTTLGLKALVIQECSITGQKKI